MRVLVFRRGSPRRRPRIAPEPAKKSSADLPTTPTLLTTYPRNGRLASAATAASAVFVGVFFRCRLERWPPGPGTGCEARVTGVWAAGGAVAGELRLPHSGHPALPRCRFSSPASMVASGVWCCPTPLLVNGPQDGPCLSVLEHEFPQQVILLTAYVREFRRK